MLNSESSLKYTYGWKIIRETGNIDVTADIIKPYYQTSTLKMHLDNNIIEPNNYYTITFEVKGDTRYYTGMNSNLTSRIFFGIPPKAGKCQVDLQNGYAIITQFTFNASGWTDSKGIKQYNFYYSFDDGDIFIPIFS